MSAGFDGSTASFNASGVFRYFGAAFLLFWLAGWAFGEVFALGFLVLLIRSIVGSVIGVAWPIPGGDWIAGGAAGFALLFIVLWLSLWTVGGYAAIRELLRNLAGEDRMTANPMSLELVRRAGPFRRTRVFDRRTIRHVRMRERDKAVVIDTMAGTEVLTQYGNVSERASLVEWLRTRLGLPAAGTHVDSTATPRGWTMTIEGGAARLNRVDDKSRLIGAAMIWFITFLITLIWYGSLQNGTRLSSGIALAITLLCASWAVWATWSRREWLVRHGEITRHGQFAFWQWDRAFKSARLAVTTSVDSDNDVHYALSVTDEQGEKTIAREIHDGTDTIDLARWLAARTGFPLKLP